MKKDRAEDFDNFEMEPSGGVWDKIEVKLPAKKNRRWFIFWIMSGIIFIAGALQYLSNLNSTKNNDKRIVSPTEQRANDDLNKNINSSVLHETTQNNIYEKKSTINYNKGKGKITKDENLLISENKSNKNGLNSFNRTTGIVKVKKEQSVNQEEKLNEESNSDESKNNLTGQAIAEIPMKNYFLDEKIPVEDVKRKKRDTEIKEKILSRWSLFACSGFTYTKKYNFSSNTFEQEDINVKGTGNFMFGAGVSYDFNQRFKISIGISKIILGQTSNSPTEVFLHGSPGDPGKQYSFLSPSGNLSGNGQEFDRAFFNSADTSVFPYVQQATLMQDTSKTLTLNLREEFHYVEFPLTVTYKFTERKITPFAGMTFATSYLIKNEILLNETRLYYANANKPADFLFSAGLTIGADVYLTRRLSLFVDGFYLKGLNSIISGENKWKPDFYGCSVGIGYRL